MPSETMVQLHIGTAGWQLPKDLSVRSTGSVLERYAELFNSVEINSTHYRHHMERTYIRWSASVPAAFRFAVKMHRDITHVQRLTRVRPMQEFMNEVQALGDRLGPVLVQLPPSLPWSETCDEVLQAMREVYSGGLVLEPRHPTWAEPRILTGLRKLAIAVVAADPPLITWSLLPQGDHSLCYFRLHGQPRVYWSAYEEATLVDLSRNATDLLRAGSSVWVIFDNTASGEAALNARRLQELMSELRKGEVVVPTKRERSSPTRRQKGSPRSRPGGRTVR